MRYKIGRNPVYRAPIPALIGGINTASSSDIVGDNQLSNCLNMMAMDGILRTRPGFVVNNDDSGIMALQSTAKNIKKYDFTEEFEREYATGNAETGGIKLEKRYGKVISVWFDSGDIEFYHVDKNAALISIGTISTGGEIINEFTVVGNDGLYAFVTAEFAGAENDVTRTYDVYKYENNNGESDVMWEKLNLNEDACIPVVATNCRTDGKGEPTFSGDFIAGYNLLSNKYKIQYTAFNEELGRKSHLAAYALPHKIPIGSDVIVEITDGNGEVHTHTVKIEGYDNSEDTTDANGNVTNNKETDDIVVRVFGKTVFLNRNSTAGGYVTDSDDWWADDGEDSEGNTYESHIILPGYNNITITAEYELDEEAKKRIFSATCTAWYGGNRGLESGTRLFIGGMEGKYKNVLQWADLANPLYFPENCNAEVGEPSQAITGFGKQGDMLVIFKPFEIYAANYLLQDAPTDAASYDFISDLTVTTAVFPLTQISGNIGCDCPGTIQLCRNRLCWVHSNGKAYTLVSSSQYNEKNIYELSDPIKRALPNLPTEELKNASSTDWEGYYVLSAGQHIFLMQYESYGYSRIYSYTSEEAASHKLPWFYLTLPFKPNGVMCIENELVAISQQNEKIFIHRADRNAVKDDVISFKNADITVGNFGVMSVDEMDIPSMVQSKIFDFSRPEIKKAICHILAEIGGTDGNSVKLSVITDRSRRSDFIEKSEYISPISRYNEYSVEGTRIVTPMAEEFKKTVSYIDGDKRIDEAVVSLDSSAPDFFRMIRINPGVFGVRKFAVRLESEGAFSLGQVCIEYKMLGSVN